VRTAIRVTAAAAVAAAAAASWPGPWWTTPRPRGSLSYDPRHGLLYAVNAGSDTISVFAVRGDRLALRQVLGSGGTFPVSVAVHGDLVYVLNALNGGSVPGYRVLGAFLARIPGSHRGLGLDPNATPQFTTTPGQVAFTPDGTQLVVTTKGNGNDIDVFGVGFGGRLSAKPTVNAEPGTVPFAISFDPFGHLVIAEAGTNAVSTFQLSRGSTASLLHRTPTGQAATCWVTTAGRSCSPPTPAPRRRAASPRRPAAS
jgi:DNA-binding beta-propeller fold protein YncE